ncbi:hypothetical protein K488DRAFT_69875 [Vararia minispora EC-137]|uniref:Uncharacterized protein n=1 Tax=Vararia minispora EC-137 TaxID=1314806 RepID=A0ACB8QP71_9AGAM|nr:hypothetical protein K488DRAFT_69875 [Vararia minispora EC-137]
MTTTPFPWTEPLRLRFTALDPRQTSLYDAGPPSPPLVFAARSRSSGSTEAGSAATSTASANGWDGPGGALRLSVMGDPSPEPPALVGPASTESSAAPRTPATRPLYVVHTEHRRARWPRRLRTFVSRGDSAAAGARVATIFWPASRAGRAAVELAHGARGRIEIEGWRGWMRGRWRWRWGGARDEQRAVVVQGMRGTRYVWILVETAPDDAADDDFKLQLVPTDAARPPSASVRDEDCMAVLEFDDDDPPPALPPHVRKPRLDRALLTIRVREDNEARLRELRDLSVVSAIFALARVDFRLLLHIPQPPPRLDSPRLLSPLDMLLPNFGFGTRPSTPERGGGWASS